MDRLTTAAPFGLGEHAAKRALWDAFCLAHDIAQASVPLLDTDAEGQVEVVGYGRDQRSMLRRSPAMESSLAGTVEQVLGAPAGSAQGVLYIMLRLDETGRVVPLYIGRAGRYGRTGEISANLASIRANSGKFARWGYNYAYHLGDLSAAVLPGHLPSAVSPKYRRWARCLFEAAPSPAPRLRVPVRFWCTAWGPHSPGIWPEFGSCTLAFMEYLLIGVAALLFPADLLNEEGVSRPAAVRSDTDT